MVYLFFTYVFLRYFYLGLRNIGHLINADSNIVKCYEDNSNTMSIRVAAVDTLRQ